MRAAVHDGTTVLNVIVVDSEDFDPGPGLQLVALADDSLVSTGWHVTDTGDLVPADTETPAPPTMAELKAMFDDLADRVGNLEGATDV